MKTFGSGWGDFYPTVQVTDTRQLRDGDVILEYSPQFQSRNVIRVTRTQFNVGKPGEKVYGIFVNPARTSEPRIPGDREFCIWDFSVTDGADTLGKSTLYKADSFS